MPCAIRPRDHARQHIARAGGRQCVGGALVLTIARPSARCDHRVRPLQQHRAFRRRGGARRFDPRGRLRQHARKDALELAFMRRQHAGLAQQREQFLRIVRERRERIGIQNRRRTALQNRRHQFLRRAPDAATGADDDGIEPLVASTIRQDPQRQQTA